MYDAIVVDDEFWILQGIHKTLHKYGTFLNFTDITTNPAQALDHIVHVKTDVVFTDIRMPQISGLKLIEYARQQGSNAIFVVISGYDDFNYAHSALRLSVYDYLLKPLEEEAVEDLMLRLKEKLDARRQENDAVVLDCLTDPSQDKRKLLSQAGLLPVCDYCLAVITCDEVAVETPVAGQYSAVQIRLDTHRQISIFSSDYQTLRTLASSLPLVINPVLGSTGISSVAGIDDLHRLIREADIAACNHFLYGDGAVGVSQYVVSDFSILDGYIARLHALFEKENYEEIRILLKQITELFASADLTMEHVEYVYNQIVALLLLYCKEHISHYDLDFARYDQLVDRFVTFKKLCRYLSEIVNSFEDNRSWGGSDTTKAYFDQLLEYVNTHYDQEISLKNLSSRFFINQNYCCYLFTKTTGKGFSAYVTALRMEKAKQYLSRQDIYINQVSKSVGYKDHFYFSKVFKKYNGITPSQYREEIKKGNSYEKV